MLPTVDDLSSQELPKRYICLECGKRFVRPGSLTTHTYSHTGEVNLFSLVPFFVAPLY